MLCLAGLGPALLGMHGLIPVLLQPAFFQPLLLTIGPSQIDRTPGFYAHFSWPEVLLCARSWRLLVDGSCTELLLKANGSCFFPELPDSRVSFVFVWRCAIRAPHFEKGYAGV